MSKNIIYEIHDKERPVRITPDKKYPNMYRLQWKDGTVSVKYNCEPGETMPDGNPVRSYGMYNLCRANDLLRNYNTYYDEYQLYKKRVKCAERNRQK